MEDRNPVTEVAVIDYGMGNLRSVLNAFAALEQPAFVACEPHDLLRAGAIVLPGVGAFGDAMDNLRTAGWIEILEHEVRRGGKPYLGLCLGLELLGSRSTEGGLHEGLGWIPGLVDRIRPNDPSIRVPHIGWNDVTCRDRDGLYAGLGETEAFYFVHSYALTPDDPNCISGTCAYGQEFAASVEVDNLSATQYHPEKSHKAGIAVVRNFLRKAGLV